MRHKSHNILANLFFYWFVKPEFRFTAKQAVANTWWGILFCILGAFYESNFFLTMLMFFWQAICFGWWFNQSFADVENDKGAYMMTRGGPTDKEVLIQLLYLAMVFSFPFIVSDYIYYHNADIVKVMEGLRGK